MYQFYVLIIIFLLYLLVSRICKNIFKPYSLAQTKKSEELRNYDGTKGIDIEELQTRIRRKMPLISMAEEEREDLRKKLYRLNIDKTVDELRQLQALYAGVCLVLGLLMTLFVAKVLGFIILGCTYIAWKYPIMSIENEVNRRDKAVSQEMPDLYSVIFYAYKRNNTANLTQKIQSYMTNCGDLFYRELSLFVEDSRISEWYALDQFKKRVPIGIVMRFCDIMKLRLEGYDNLNVMENFKTEMEARRAEREDILLNSLYNKLQIISWVGVSASLGVLLLIYFGTQLMISFSH